MKHPTKLEKNWAKKMKSSTDNVWQIEHSNTVLVRTHSPEQCMAEVCVLHHMTDHSMRSFPQHWRDDRGIMERICTHGIGHPDFDQVPFWRATRPNDYKWELIHGCDGCCVPDIRT